MERKLQTPSLVSVIIPAHNAGEHIEAAIHSALSQSYARLEVIVVDDGSTDETADLVAAIALRDSRVVLIRQKNAGVAAARNRAIEYSSGVYVAPLDADDIWYPDKIAAQVERMEAEGPPPGFVYCWWIAMNQRGTVTGAASAWIVEGDVFNSLLYVNFVGNASVPLFRRSALNQVGGYDSSLRSRGGQGCEDWDLTLRVAARFPVGLARGYHAAYRGVHGSMSADTKAMSISHRLIMETLCAQDPEIPGELRVWSRSNFVLYLAGVARGSGRPGQTLRWLAEAIVRDPAVLLAPWVLQSGWRSIIHAGLYPIIRLIWPDHRDWIDFKRRLGGPTQEDLSRELLEARAVPGQLPWGTWRPFDRISRSRWLRTLSATKKKSATVDVRDSLLEYSGE